MFLDTRKKCEWHLEISKIQECIKQIAFPTSASGYLDDNVKPYLELMQESVDKLRALAE